ncbi:MAG: hypothetical protein E7488_03310 [Ruminococcaceae bacterium]|nr:hypothetical protein [Oscillospiraceae bacterium]
MNKLDIATKVVGCIVVALIFVGLFNLPMMNTLIPYILIGTAITLALYVINAFKTHNYGRMITILILAAFVVVILWYNRFI